MLAYFVILYDLQNVSNLWEDEAKWLKLSDPGVSQILAIAVDPLTENIFYIIPERGLGISEVIASCSSEVIELGNGLLFASVSLCT